MSVVPPLLLRGTVVLRALDVDDWRLEQQLSRDPEVVRWTYYPTHLDETGARGRIETALEGAARGSVRRYVVLDVDGRALGTCGLGRLESVPEVFYAILPEHRGRGVATAATSVLADWVLGAGEPQVALETIEHNLASERVAEKAGFVVGEVLEGEHRGEQVTITRWIRAR